MNFLISLSYYVNKIAKSGGNVMYRNMLPNKQFPFVNSFKLGTAYVPYQILNCIMEPKKALSKGTIFPELYFSYKDRPKKFLEN